jgi:hypothetical protein
MKPPGPARLRFALICDIRWVHRGSMSFFGER